MSVTATAGPPTLARVPARTRPRLLRYVAAAARHPLLAYVVKRLAVYVLTLWAAITASFFFYHLIPGDPVGTYLQNLQAQGTYSAQAGTEAIAHYRKVFGLDGSLLSQYGHYMYQLVIKHDLGPSLTDYPRPAQSVIAAAIPWTVGLLAIATILAWLVGTALGALAGWFRGRWMSSTAVYASIGISNIPFYFVALILVFFVSYRWDVLPSEYAYDPTQSPGLSWGFLSSVIQHGILPAVSIVIVSGAACLLGMRQQMLTVLGEDYLTLAEAKGLHPWHVLRRYALPNAYLPQITALLISFGFIFNGNVLIENLFNYPGIGRLLLQAVNNLDINTMMGITAVAIFMVLTSVLLVDLTLPLFDPRIRRGGAS